MKYLKYLQTTNDFESFKNSESYILPNVSYIVGSNEVKYNPALFESKTIICTYIIDEQYVNTPVKLINNANAVGWTDEYEFIIDGVKITYNEEDGTYSDENILWDDNGCIVYTFSSVGIHTFEFVPALDEFDIDNNGTMESVYAISNDMFRDCYTLHSIQIPDVADEIAISDCAFVNCENLQEIDFSENVKYFGGFVFENCSSNPVVIFNSMVPPQIAADTFFMGDYSGMTIKVPAGSDYSEWQNNTSKYYPGYYSFIKFETI